MVYVPMELSLSQTDQEKLIGDLVRQAMDSLPPEQRRGYFRHYWKWANKGEPHPIADPAWGWLDAHWPDDGEFIELCWGDARPGNQMYRDGEVVGVFDWEMVSLGNAESDLGWWLFVQRYHTDGTGVPLPEGMLDRDEIITYWSELMGREPTHVDFYERLGGFHFTLVLIKLFEMIGLLDPESAMPEMAVHNPVATLTAQLLDIPVPEPGT